IEPVDDDLIRAHARARLHLTRAPVEAHRALHLERTARRPPAAVDDAAHGVSELVADLARRRFAAVAGSNDGRDALVLVIAEKSAVATRLRDAVLDDEEVCRLRGQQEGALVKDLLHEIIIAGPNGHLREAQTAVVI